MLVLPLRLKAERNVCCIKAASKIEGCGACPSAPVTFWAVPSTAFEPGCSQAAY